MESDNALGSVLIHGRVLARKVQLGTNFKGVLVAVLARLAFVGATGLDLVEVPAVRLPSVFGVDQLLPLVGLARTALRTLESPFPAVGLIPQVGDVIAFDAALRDEQRLALPDKRRATGKGFVQVTLGPEPDFVTAEEADGTTLEVLLVIRTQHPDRVAFKAGLLPLVPFGVFHLGQRRRRGFPHRAEAILLPVLCVVVDVLQEQGRPRRASGDKGRPQFQQG